MARQPVAADTEVLPEADRLEGFPHPRETAALIGQDAALNVLSEAFQSGRMHHGWLIAGPSGIGKATLAYKIARMILARPEERDLFGDGLSIEPGSPTDRQVRALSHPGLLLLRRTYDVKTKRFAQRLPIDEVRRLRGFLALSAEGENWRVVIVDSADDLNLNSANALLKSLEEPPARTVFLILTSAPGRLLPTIRSRCRVVSLAPLGDQDLIRATEQALTAAEKPLPDEAAWQGLLAVADGSVGRALSMIEGGGLALKGRIDGILKALPKLDLKAVHALGDDLQSQANTPKFELFFDLYQSRLARLIAAQATGQGAPDDISLAGRIIGPDRLATFAELWETTARDKADANSLNLDRKLLIVGSFARLEAASRR
ncbi:DNA polymerase III subunit delta' [Hyphomicrobium methylovorum]|uniref:DNA polymerase III subunit delta' n=1 Tax=Hyphomicrobium methylovorum TaxID=84 RepID=UPI0015E76960|nr:DNA polymerase III subunit delta' [Hyphomicrobium methylovorum]MBA2127734.1 DNA polymerase III subunit delta' [Hyphomicrobium methylovorum]